MRVQYLWYSKNQRLLTRPMIHCNEHLQIMIHGLKELTVAIELPRRDFFFFSFKFYFVLSWGGGCKGSMNRKGWEVEWAQDA